MVLDPTEPLVHPLVFPTDRRDRTLGGINTGNVGTGGRWTVRSVTVLEESDVNPSFPDRRETSSRLLCVISSFNRTPFGSRKCVPTYNSSLDSYSNRKKSPFIGFRGS